MYLLWEINFFSIRTLIPLIYVAEEEPVGNDADVSFSEMRSPSPSPSRPAPGTSSSARGRPVYPVPPPLPRPRKPLGDLTNRDLTNRDLGSGSKPKIVRIAETEDLFAEEDPPVVEEHESQAILVDDSQSFSQILDEEGFTPEERRAFDALGPTCMLVETESEDSDGDVDDRRQVPENGMDAEDDDRHEVDADLMDLRERGDSGCADAQEVT